MRTKFVTSIAACFNVFIQYYKFKLGLNIRFDAIKNLVIKGTVCTKPLRMCSFP
jgi:hypothetical protein